MGWGNWTRRSQGISATREPLGVDLNAGRARAAHGKAGRNKPFMLDDPEPDLALAVSLDKRVADVGKSALAVCRKLPHVICSGYLPLLGETKEWKSGRHKLTVDAALALAFERMRSMCHGHEGVAFALPTYLKFAQVGKLVDIADKAKLKVRGTAAAPLALAAERATHFLKGSNGEAAEASRTGRSIAPTSVLIVDADDHAMTAAVVRISEHEVRGIQFATMPRLGLKHWRERILDSLAERCVRQCRRDPRDTAEAEQMLYDQIEGSIERARTGQRIDLSVRVAHWYQDLHLTPIDLDTFCAPLFRQAAEEIRALVATPNDAEPPRAVWLTHDAGRLPGLAAALHQNVAERTNVRVLHPEAAAAAVANLVDRWSAGELPRTHLDTAIPLPPREDARAAAPAPAVHGS